MALDTRLSPSPVESGTPNQQWVDNPGTSDPFERVWQRVCSTGPPVEATDVGVPLPHSVSTGSAEASAAVSSEATGTLLKHRWRRALMRKVAGTGLDDGDFAS